MKKITPIKVGIIGVGNVGSLLHLPLLSNSDKFIVRGAYDLSKNRLKEVSSKFNIDAYSSYEEILCDKEVELVVIATPTSTHEEYSIMAMEAEKHVVVEKPISTNSVSAQKMIGKSDEKKRVLSVCQNRLWDGVYLTIKRLIEDGVLGEVFVIEIRCHEFGVYLGASDITPDWRTKAKYGGGLLIDWGSHHVYWLLELTKSEPKRIFCNLQKRMWSKEVEDYFKLVIEFENNIITQCEASQVARLGLPFWYVIGTKGTLKVDEFDKPSIVVKANLNGEEKEFKPEIYQDEHISFYNNIYDVIREKKDLIVTPHKCKKVLEILEQGFRSKSSGGDRDG